MDADTNYVENGDDGSKRLKVDGSVEHAVPDALTLSRALRRGKYTSGEARMLQQTLSQFFEQSLSCANNRNRKWRRFNEHYAGWSIVLRRGTKKKCLQKHVVGDLNRSTDFKIFQDFEKCLLLLLVLSKSTSLQSHPALFFVRSVVFQVVPSLSLRAGQIFLHTLHRSCLVNKAYSTLRLHRLCRLWLLVLIRLLLLVMLSELKFGFVRVCSLARMICRVGTVLCSTAIVKTVLRAFDLGGVPATAAER